MSVSFAGWSDPHSLVTTLLLHTCQVFANITEAFTKLAKSLITVPNEGNYLLTPGRAQFWMLWMGDIR
jgi:hypothetical protein